ncbi:MAG: hypothetical protein LBK26_03760 [Rickettsiales bacterium]|jgi:hypothetical protein|nr:hypothetical protein [Rickettsiales bacterium]
MTIIKLISNYKDWNAARNACSLSKKKWRNLRDKIVNCGIEGEKSCKKCINYKMSCVQNPIQMESNFISSDASTVVMTRTNCEHYHGYNPCTIPFCEHTDNNKLAMEAKQTFLHKESQRKLAWSILWGRKRIPGIGE